MPPATVLPIMFGHLIRRDTGFPVGYGSVIDVAM